MKACGKGDTRMKENRSDRIFNFLSLLLMAILCLLILYPMYFIVIASVSSPEYVLSGQVILFPKGLNLEGYKRIFHYDMIWNGYANSLFYSVVGALISSSVTLMAAYPLSRKDFSASRPLTIFFLIAMFFQGGLIPQYILVNSLHLRNTYWVLLCVSAVQVMNLLMASSYFRSSYEESLFEASQIDGCTHFGYFFRILLPISTPIIIVMLLFYGVWQWNDYFRAMIYLDKEKYYPIQLVLKDLLASNQVSGPLFEMLTEDQDAYEEMLKAAESMKYGIIVIASLPMLLIYIFLQRFFVKGITLGSVKG